MTSSALQIAIADAAMLACAAASFASTIPEVRGALVKRWRLLVPGILAALADAILIAYPEYRDLFQLELWTVNTVALIAGLVRGGLMSMFSDHNLGVVRLRRTWDGMLVALAMVGFGALQTWIELRMGTENRQEEVMEFFMTVTAGYLFGRSVAAWLRAGMIQHDDLDRPL